MSTERYLLELAAGHAADWVEAVDRRPVFASATVAEMREALGGPLPDEPTEPAVVIDALARDAEPGLTAFDSGRFYGFVVGGTLPVALAADWLVSAWDQNAGLALPTPAATAIEEIAGAWLKDILGIPAHASFAFVTGCQTAHLTALAVARGAVLDRHGWNLAEGGLQGAPEIRVIVAEKRHVTIDRALRMLGIGERQIVRVPVDAQGRALVDELRAAVEAGGGPTIVCTQAGEVNTGSFEDFHAIADICEAHGAWLHLDGAFGLWAAASPRFRHLTVGAERADSWATDAHKWLNVPYDCGVAFCAHPEAHREAMRATASYLVQVDESEGREPMAYTPEFSRRARSVPVYAALRQLGRGGVAALVERCCDAASGLAEGFAGIPGCTVLNDVVLNQVLVRFDDDAHTTATLAALQADGETWTSGTTWEGRAAIRFSVSGWRTTGRDVERTVIALARAAEGRAS